MNYMQIDKASINNGLGFRVVLWCSGCSLHCEGCQNLCAQDFNAGKPFDETAKQFLFEQLSKPYIKGLTLSGGHPLDKQNRETVYFLLKEIKERFPAKDIWIYTGYRWEDIIDIREIQHILCYTDVLVDGSYIKGLRDITLAFRGSENQRLIDVKETLKQGEIITLQND